MIYVETSVVLAALLAEHHVPPSEFWQSELVSSRLTQYEVLVRLHVRRVDEAILANAGALLRSLEWLELAPAVLTRALEPFPHRLALRTLDALHLASAHYLRAEGFRVRLATYDRRLAAAALAIGLELAEV